jgi:hypothetical protein
MSQGGETDNVVFGMRLDGVILNGFTFKLMIDHPTSPDTWVFSATINA